MLLRKEYLFPLFIGSSLFFFYFCLASYGLLNNNEGLYAQIAIEILQSGDWVIPHLNGVPYIEKSPLLYWLVALSFKLFGPSVFAARLVPATCGALTAYLLSRFEPHDRQTRWLPSILLASAAGFFIFSRIVFFDILLTLFLTLTLFCVWNFYARGQKKFLRVGAISLAGSVLAKGFVALPLIGFALILFLVWEKKPQFVWKLLDPFSIVIFLALIIPWHLLAHLSHEGFSWFYFINEHWMRFLDKRIPRDYYRGPIYYYIPRVLAYFLPWVLTVPFLGRMKWADTAYKRFLLSWFLGFLLFFSLSKAKANYYMIAGLPPLCLLLGHFMAQSKRMFRILITGVSLSITLLGVGIYVARLKEPELTVRPSIRYIDVQKDIYLFKRFEELSTLPFYAGRPIPILMSESKDLWYGQQCGTRPDLFPSLADFKAKLGPSYMYVLKRDLAEFNQLFMVHPRKLVYTSAKYDVYLL